MIMTKRKDVLKKIGEVSKDLNIPIHIIRFWEKKFPSLNPIKKPNGMRYFSEQQLGLLGEIKDLLYVKKYTIEGAKKFLSKKNFETQDKHLIQELEKLICEINKRI